MSLGRRGESGLYLELFECVGTVQREPSILFHPHFTGSSPESVVNLGVNGQHPGPVYRVYKVQK